MRRITMKFVGLFNGEFKIIEDLDWPQLEKLKPDFMWLDVNRIDPASETALKKLYGISSLTDIGFSPITPLPGYDLLRVSYFEQGSRRDFKIFASEKFVITAHEGIDAISEETMASVNEMLVSGGLNTESVLKGIFSTVIEKHATQLQNFQNITRNISLKLKEGLSDTSYITQLSESSHETQKVFYRTKAQLLDIALGIYSVRGVKDSNSFASLYSRMDELSGGSDYFAGIANQYSSALLSYTWDRLKTIKRTSSGIALLSFFFALAAIFPIFFPNGLSGIDTIYIIFGLIAAGGIALLAEQRGLVFRA